MRYVSQLFQPIITIPKNAKIKNTEITCKSQKLLLECGLVRPTSSGLFTLLPLARRALDKLEALVRMCIEDVGAQRLSLPSLTAADLWRKTGRLDDVGPELMNVTDRHDKKYLLAPTHEEAVADLLSDVGPLSYKQLPLLLYQISNKYRDEHRPKHGLLRAREFLMMDAYGAHASEECVARTYQRVTDAYTRLFDVLRLPVHRVSAPVGDMGGSMSHEWQLCVRAGEDEIHVCASCSHAELAGDGARCSRCGNETDRCNSVEVGHTFALGRRYSEPLGALTNPASGSPEPLLMTCYGIGLTRLLAASVEALSTDTSIRWPRAIAPYRVLIVGPKEGSKEWSQHGAGCTEELRAQVEQHVPGDVIIDDRHNLTIGKRLMMADRVGYPTMVVCGRELCQRPPRYEVVTAGSTQLLTADELCRHLAEEHVQLCNKTIAH